MLDELFRLRDVVRQVVCTATASPPQEQVPKLPVLVQSPLLLVRAQLSLQVRVPLDEACPVKKLLLCAAVIMLLLYAAVIK